VNAFDDWLAALEARHLAELTFPEVSRALKALSSTYVERRQKIAEGAALTGRGKRAAFALFYGPLHHLLVAHIVRSLPGAQSAVPSLVDLGCGTGASGAAWASAIVSTSVPVTMPRIIAVDVNAWALGEAALTYRAFGIAASTKQGNITAVRLPPSPAAFLAAFTLNEMPDASRDELLARLLERGRQGDRVLVIEPVGGFVARWWSRWSAEFVSAGGRADEWRVRVDLPNIVAKLDRAAGMNHRELTGRSLWLGQP
jgi:hypothetical protein